MRNPFRTRYRIVEVTGGSKPWFVPQYRPWFWPFWLSFMTSHTGHDWSPQQHDTKADAEQVIYAHKFPPHKRLKQTIHEVKDE